MKNSDRIWGLRPFVLGGVSALALTMAAPVYAQDTDDTASGDDERIVVTGSRIRRDEFTSSAPVQIIDPTIAEFQGVFNTADLLQSSPLAQGSAQITAAISSNFVTNGGAGAQTVSLRGLGAARTLVLLNGRRAGPAGTRGAVSAFDLNVLPQSIIQRVEILKDGASSIYGSDAVAGVVNIITNTDTDGIQVDAFGAVPFNSGGEEFRAAATYGKTFNRGHFLATVDYYNRVELDRGDRDFLDCSEDYVFFDDGTGKSNGQRADAIDPRTGKFKCNDTLWGHIWLYDYQYYYSPNGSNLIAPAGNAIRRMQFNYAGDNLQNFIPPLPAPLDPFQFSVPAGWFPVGYDPASYAVENAHHPFISNQTIVPRTELFTLYADGAFQINEDVEAYGELLLNRRETEQTSFRQFWQYGYTENFFPGFGDPFAPGFNGSVVISPTALTDWSGSAQRVDYMRGVVGLRGEFGEGPFNGFLDGWAWDVFGQYSRSKGYYYQQQILDDALQSQNFRLGSCVGTVTPISGRNCIDIDWTDPGLMAGEVSPQIQDFLWDTETGDTLYTQLNFEAIATGDLFELPSGAVSAAIGVSWRQDEIDDQPGPLTQAGNAWGTTTAGITAGDSTTQEVFGELFVPLLKDKPFVESLEVSLAGRYTDVDTYGTGTTYKISANWQMFPGIRFRGTTGTSFRAPALFELFLADETSFLSQRFVDPCIQWGNALAAGTITQQFADNCAADGVPSNHTGAGVTATIITGGGFGVLEAETSLAHTVSVILEPEFFDDILPESTRLSLAFDYFAIEINGEVSQLGAGAIVTGCYASEFFPNEPLCDLFERGGFTSQPVNISEVRDSFLNVNSQFNAGLDLTARLEHDLPDGWGMLSVLAQATWQFEDDIALFEGNVTDVNGRTGEPKFVGDLNVLWHAPDDWTVFYGLDVIGRTSDNAEYIRVNGALCNSFVTRPGSTCVDLQAESVYYHTLSVTKEYPMLSITAGIRNLTGEEPPQISNFNSNANIVNSFGNAPAVSNYDYVGRRAFLNVTKKF